MAHFDRPAKTDGNMKVSHVIGHRSKFENSFDLIVFLILTALQYETFDPNSTSLGYNLIPETREFRWLQK